MLLSIKLIIITKNNSNLVSVAGGISNLQINRSQKKLAKLAPEQPQRELSKKLAPYF
jgi:hypothetical protein